MKHFLLFAFSIGAFADVITLKDGRTISGQIESATSDDVRVNIAGNAQTLPVDRIQSIRFDHRITLPAGAEIAIRTIEVIDSKRTDKYREYSASLDDPITVDGVEVAPVNAKAVLRVTDTQRSGIKRRASLDLSLVAVTIDGHRVEVKTNDVDSKSGSQAKRTATGAAAGAATGAAIGAMAGGGVGAGIGAGIGAAGGTAAAVIMGKGVKIPSETRFTYKLSQPVEIAGDADQPDLPAAPRADTLTLRNGRNLTGAWIGIDGADITFQRNNQPEKHSRSEVSAVTFKVTAAQ